MDVDPGGVDRSLPDLPLGLLAAVVAVGVVAGFLAAVRPARRAARIDVLAAIATE